MSRRFVTEMHVEKDKCTLISQEPSKTVTPRAACFPSPVDAMLRSSHETLIYVTCVANHWKLTEQSDFLAVVDVDRKSPTFSKVIHKVYVPHKGDELHHTGWNACSSCKDARVKRDKLIMPCLFSDRIYVVDVSEPRTPKLFKEISPEELHKKGAGAPHTVHCLPSGDVMISCLGDAEGNGKGTFILLEKGTFEVKGTWQDECESVKLNYDFWYQPRYNVMASTEWSAPKTFRPGFSVQDVKDGRYGHSVTFWDWSSRKVIKTVDLGPDGQVPLEIRFCHDPNTAVAYVGCALSSTVFKLFRTGSGVWTAEKIISVPPRRVKNWFMPEMPGFISDIVLSLDDRFLYIANWLQGDVRQYVVGEVLEPILVAQIYLGGCMTSDTKVVFEVEDAPQPERPSVKGMPLRGGPQMLQLSLDGKRLYVTNSLLSTWDAQFHPDVVQSGSMMVLLHVDNVNGGLVLDPDFLVDFGNLGEAPVLAHEMRFPEGDCTSDIWV